MSAKPTVPADSRSFRHVALLILVAAMAVLAAVQFYRVMDQVQKLANPDISDNGWPPFQLQAELYKFDLALKDFSATGQDRGRLEMRVDLLASRVEPVMQLAFAWPEGTRQEMLSIRDTVDRWASAIHAMPSDAERSGLVLAQIATDVDRMRPGLQKLILMVHELQSLDADEKRRDIRGTFQALAITLGLLGAGTLAFFVALQRRNRREMQLNRQLEEWNATLEARVEERTEQIHEQKELLQRILAASPVGVAIQEAGGGRTVFLNTRMKDAVGVADARSMRPLKDYLVHDGDVDKLAGAMARGETVGNMEAEIRGADGYFYGLLSARRIDLDGRPMDLFWLYDISDRKKLENRLRDQARTDSLTGALNHGSFRGALDKAIAESRTDGAELSLVLMDVDHFKFINDHFGHAAGDVTLKRLVDLARDELRDHDILGRLGGEEFGIVLSGAGADQAANIAERLRGAFEAAGGEGPLPLFTASFGVAVMEGRDTVASLMERADRALYRAKHGGRNRVEVHGGEALAEPGMSGAQS
ncbi:sensor domain-containing diguanylate cyclase [Paludibacterium paludis]|uniref:diguanylate cyclase n=1 Tax=Paludibacterium paludis TaxID=1225769 RepID=A0A918U9D0_9NEIS|nr:GGDEF domain-containing protein [Paludibacterium paludis]GGY13018.1 GGDEF domain-containing protein [Paludibacterium paludis]